MENEHNSVNPGGETLNDRLRRAAAMARQRAATPGVDPDVEASMRAEEAHQEPHHQAEPQHNESQQTPREPESPAVENPHATVEPTPTRRYSQEDLRARLHADDEADDEARFAAPVDAPRHAHRGSEQEEYEVVEQRPRKNKSLALWIGILIALLVVAAIAVVFMSVKHSREAAEQQQQIEQLQLANEQMQLANEYAALNNEFAQYENQTSLLANDSIVQKYSAARAQVEKLLQELKNEKNKSAAQIKKLQDEIGTLKGILRQYVEQINQLNQENQELRSENQEVKAQNQQLTQTVQTVQANNKVLNERMTLAEKLNVTGVTLTPLNKKGKTEKNVTKARQLMVSFTIPQNNSTPVGEKVIWVRIVNPEGDVLPGGGNFSFEGSTITATARKTIEYGGEEIGGITVYWDVNTTLTPGEYTVELFCDNYRLVSKRITLKK